MSIKTDTYRVYCHRVQGYFPYGRGYKQGITFNGGCFDTDDPIVVEAAMRDWSGAQKTVQTIERLDTKPAPPVPSPEPIPPPPDIQCKQCPELVPAIEWREHQREHGRENRKRRGS